MSSYTVVYRTGGTENAEWRRAVPVGSKAEAEKIAAELRRYGRKALVHKTDELNRIGMPEGWEA